MQNNQRIIPGSCCPVKWECPCLTNHATNLVKSQKNQIALVDFIVISPVQISPRCQSQCFEKIVCASLLASLLTLICVQ